MNALQHGDASADKVVAASELATFVFCPHAWRLHYVAGIRPGQKRLQRGAAAHGIHATQVLASRRILAMATLLALLALAGLVGAWFVLGGQP
jgi:hypothetical protein